MKFSTVLITLSMAASALADLHSNALCYNETSNRAVYNDAATNQACTWYSLRNKGDDWWNTCPDCVMITSGNRTPFCNSAAGHIGGDEITYYCQLAGATNAKAN